MPVVLIIINTWGSQAFTQLCKAHTVLEQCGDKALVVNLIKN